MNMMMRTKKTKLGLGVSSTQARLKYLKFALLIILVILSTLTLHQQAQNLIPSPKISVGKSLPTSLDEADRIIQRSYELSYAHILKCAESSWKHEDVNTAVKCMEQTRDHIMSKAGSSVPWWFKTLLRDILSKTGGVYASWHYFNTANPPFHFCTIDKVATTEWRGVFTKLNAQDCHDESSSCKDRPYWLAWRTTQEMPANAPWAVFVRDPLERLLSGYLDKCYRPKTRRDENAHCEPNVVFNPVAGLVDGTNKSYPNLLDGLIDIEGQEKAMFGAYVDVLPLRWNNFVLHRNFDKYDFVGNMNKDFHFELDRMAKQFGGQLPTALNNTLGTWTMWQMTITKTLERMVKDMKRVPRKMLLSFILQGL